MFNFRNALVNPVSKNVNKNEMGRMRLVVTYDRIIAQPKIFSEAQSPNSNFTAIYHIFTQTKCITNLQGVSFSCGAFPWQFHNF